MTQVRFWATDDALDLDTDSAGNLVLYVDDECVRVEAVAGGHSELVGREPEFDAYRGE